MPNIEEITQLKNEGFSNKEIADKLSTEEEPLVHQNITKIIKDNTAIATQVLQGEVVTNPEKFSRTFTQPEYEEYSLANGRTRYGGEKGVKVVATIEELRAYINSHWTPSMLMEKWQMNEDEMTQLVWRLSKAELRDKPVKVNFKNDFFR